MSTKGSTMRKSYNTYYKDSYDYDDGYYHNNYYYGYNSYRGRGRYYSNKYHPHHYHDNSYHHQNYYHDNSNHSPAQSNSTSNSDSSNSKTPPTNNTPPIENKETTQNNTNNTPPTVNDTTPIVTAIKSETQTPNNENINKNENITTTPIVTNNSKTTNATTTTSNSTNSIPQSRRLSVQELLGSVTTTTPPINNEEVKKEYSRVSVQDILKSTQQSVNNEQTIQNNNIKPSEQPQQEIKPPKESIENNSMPIPAIPPQTVTEEIKTCENSEEIKKDNFTPLKDIQLPKLNVNSPSYQPKVMQTPLQQPLQMLSLNSPEKEMPNGLITQIEQLFKFYDRENCGYMYIEDAFSAIVRFLPTVPPGKVENELYSYECILLPVLIEIIKNLIGSTN